MNRLVVVSNRVPVPSAGPQAGGLAVALDGLLARRGGVWFGWSGKVAADAASRPPQSEYGDGVEYATFDLTPAEHEGYYTRFSNSVLWPLLHTLPELMNYDRGDARIYRAVNRRIAALLHPLLRPTDIVWLHDYHLLPLAAALRANHVCNPIGFFLHIPFAPPDVLAAAPDVASLVRDMLAADLIGFQTENDLKNFVAAAQTFADAVRLPGNTLQVGAHRTRLGVFPVEIAAHAFADIAKTAASSDATQRLRRSMSGEKLILGIDRLDPTKGLLQRIDGVRRLFEIHPEWRRQATMLQIAATSRREVDSYRALRAELDREVGTLNSDIGDPDWMPVRLVTRAVPRDVAAGYMREAQVGLVTPVRDGMNLVAKEFVAAQDPADPGVLILSRFAGAARQLDAALLVNPHDTDALAEAINAALTMSLAERQERWLALWTAIVDRSPVGWGRTFVAALLRASAGATLPERARAEVRPTVPSFGTGEPMQPERISLIENVSERETRRPPLLRPSTQNGRQLN